MNMDMKIPETIEEGKAICKLCIALMKYVLRAYVINKINHFDVIWNDSKGR